MKTIEELKKVQVITNDWETPEDIFDDFEEPFDENIHFVYASYTYEHYEGDAYVLFIRDNKLYEIHGSHCSCYGLEHQWDEEEVTIEYLERMLENPSFDYTYGGYHATLKEIL